VFRNVPWILPVAPAENPVPWRARFEPGPPAQTAGGTSVVRVGREQGAREGADMKYGSMLVTLFTPEPFAG